MAPPVLAALGRRPGLGDLAGAVRAYLLAHPFVWLTGVVGVWVAHALAGADTPIDPLAHDTLRRLADEPRDVWWVLLILTAVVGAPIVEEVIYRGLIQNGIARLTRAPLVSVVGTSLVFALVHYGAVSAHALPTLFVLSLAFGVAYMKTGRLGVPILMHAVFNGMNVTLALLSVG
jgi:membrane protease YdiL (CAAX protease family)